MYEELCGAVGSERLRMIEELKSYELDLICLRVKNCRDCPLALHYGDGDILCMDYASTFKIRSVLKNGGYFIKKEGI
ncbi:MAG: hypothetical protein IJ038_05180 [Clostridia bacterium]|nr:hypothetical protein [Clostridia bacterium]